MPRNMSFSLTTEAVRNRTKTVTRRLGWTFLKPGDVLWACEKCQGLKKGEKIKRLALIRVVDVRPVWLSDMTPTEVVREGFLDGSVDRFRYLFLQTHYPVSQRGWDDYRVNRIEFEYIGED